MREVEDVASPICNQSIEFQLSVEYIFNIGTNRYWTLQGAEVGNDTRLEVVGEKPSAPIGFSYKCSKPLLFRNGTVTLRLNNIQVRDTSNGGTFVIQI